MSEGAFQADVLHLKRYHRGGKVLHLERYHRGRLADVRGRERLADVRGRNRR
jgi:hypothetical protein